MAFLFFYQGDADRRLLSFSLTNLNLIERLFFMGRRKTNPEEIRDRAAYTYAWLHFNKIQRDKAEQKIRENEIHIGKWQSEESQIPTDLMADFGEYWDRYLLDDEQEWIETIKNTKLLAILRSFTNVQKRIVYLFFIKNLTQQEVAIELQTSQQNISKQLKKIKKLIVNNM